MRAILIRLSQVDGEVAVRDLLGLGKCEDIMDELDRLREEGLIKHNITRDPAEISIGRVSGLTLHGRELLRDIEDERVWAIIHKTLDEVGLDLSYPLLKEVCEEIIRRYVMSKIPREI